jgi:hypothetical protein
MLAIGWIVFDETLGLRGAVASALVLVAIALSPAIRPAQPVPPKLPAGTT